MSEYLGDDRIPDDDEPLCVRVRKRYRCGGYATGHCGATDCDTCYPGWDWPMSPRELDDDEDLTF